MSTISTSIIAFTLCLFVFLLVLSKVQAQTPRVECATGQDGKQVCQTVLFERAASSSATQVNSTSTVTPKTTGTTSGTTASSSGAPAQHTVVNTGIQENIIAVLFAGFALSAFGYTYAKSKAV